MTNECFYTVAIIENALIRIDYEYPTQYKSIEEAQSFIDSHGQDDEFSLKIIKYSFDDLTAIIL